MRHGATVARAQITLPQDALPQDKEPDEGEDEGDDGKEENDETGAAAGALAVSRKDSAPGAWASRGSGRSGAARGARSRGAPGRAGRGGSRLRRWWADIADPRSRRPCGGGTELFRCRAAPVRYRLCGPEYPSHAPLRLSLALALLYGRWGALTGAIAETPPYPPLVHVPGRSCLASRARAAVFCDTDGLVGPALEGAHVPRTHVSII